tara:strand:+ start:130 stop:708 length:579 start_codon:yes stop_codon:yes gene_type:complete
MSKSKNVDRFLKSFGEEVVKRAKKNLVAAGKGGGKLERSIKSKIVKFTKGFILQWEMANYGEFQDKGVKGKGGKIGKKSIGGRRYYTTWEGKRKDSPYKFGSGRGKKGGLRKGIASFIRKKGLQPRSKGGQYMSTKSLVFLFSRSVYIRGIHGVSFFQNSLMLGMKTFRSRYADAVAKDIADNLRDGAKNKT